MFPLPVSTTNDADARRTADRSDRVLELDRPAPRATVGGVPPLAQDADLPAGQDHRQAGVALARPDVLAHDAKVVEREAAHRRLAGGVKVRADRDQALVDRPDRDVEPGW